MQRKSAKAAPKNKGRGGVSRKPRQKCECLQCNRYQAKFKPTVHPCPNFKKKKMSGAKTARKIAAPKKVITSRWVVPPIYNSQRPSPFCRCISSAQASADQSENSDSASSRGSSLGRSESEIAGRGEKARKYREEFYQAVERQAEKTSASAPAAKLEISYSGTQIGEAHLTSHISRASTKWEAREVGRAWMSPGKSNLDDQDDILMKNLPRSVSQGFVGSETSSSLDLPTSGRSISPRSRTSRKSLGTNISRSRSRESLTKRKMVRQSAKPDLELGASSSSVSFSLNVSPGFAIEESSVRVSQSSTRSHGVLKDPRSTAVRNNSARLYLEEEHLRKLQDTMEKALLLEGNGDLEMEDHQTHRASRNAALTVPDSSINSEDPVPNGRLAPSRQFMNVCAQELAKRKLIARAKAAQELDSTDLFGMESHYEVFAVEKKADGCTWGFRAYRPV